MNRNLKLTESINIKAPAGRVWQALMDPETIKKFMWGTNASSEWRKGSAITFQGEWQGKSYYEKGTILEIEKEKTMKYTYLSAGNEDKPENYAIITYNLSDDNGLTKMSVTQEGANNEQALEHSKEGWRSMLGTLKEILEK